MTSHNSRLAPLFRTAVTLGAFLALSVFLCVANWQLIGSAPTEWADPAANSLLVLDAKRSILLVGNYSRVGFNHPGPALLYVLAIGEAIFFDGLGWTASPFAAQLVAVALYNAFWILAAFGQLRRLTGFTTAALVATCAFVTASLVWHPYFFTTAWFPDLYYLPFATFLLLCARLAIGDGKALFGLGFVVGFLINAHAAFVIVTATILTMTVAANVVHYGRSDPRRRVVSGTFVRAHRVPVVVAVLGLVVFLLPLAIETVRDFPGPVADYISFGAQHRTNRLPQVFRFIGLYWNTTSSLLVLASALVLWKRRWLADETVTALRALAIVLVAATVAVFLYGRNGVDLVDQAYIAYFYESVPALGIAVLAVSIDRWIAAPHRTMFAGAVVVATVLAAHVLFTVAPDRAAEFTNASIPRDFDVVRARAAQGPLVLDLDAGLDYNALWPTLVGIATYGKRRHDVPFCIDRGWHVLFTKALRCDQERIRNGTRYLVRTVEDGAARGLRKTFAYGHVGFFAFEPPAIVDRGAYTIGEHGAVIQDYFLDDGWNLPASDSVRTETRRASMSLPVPRNFSGTVWLDVGLPEGERPARQELRIAAGGEAAKQVLLTDVKPRAMVPLGIGASPDGRVDITFELAEASYVDRKMRRPHVAFYGVTATSAPAPVASP